jgi:hypothetical protein
MPYIKQERREEILLSNDGEKEAKNPGELNYIFTLICNEYFKANPCYQTINDIIGALEGAKLEFYRRVAAPYEDKKIKENGDVY